ncbi:MAG: FAD:protein FMN transferase [Rhodobacteraceae bacterium]|nr:FAD:protein FMN transferase [Paracoccaceae bacterium]
MTTRRRFLSIVAGAVALPVIGARASANVAQWHGIALGAEAQIILDHPDADRLIASAVAEIKRLESIFSLYQTDSQLTRLNRDSVLENPAFEMIELLSICSALNARTSGAFDPTVQTLWSTYAEAYATGVAPDAGSIEKAMSVTGWRHVQYSAQRISFDRAGVRLTLNGIAQGFIADKVTNLLRDNGVSNVLVNTGEIVASGTAPSGDEWRVKLGSDDGQRVSLQNAAIATSAPLGTTFDVNGKVGHILDPRTGYPGGVWSGVSVVASSAAEADGLSTAFCLMSESEIESSKAESQVYLR